MVIRCKDTVLVGRFRRFEQIRGTHRKLLLLLSRLDCFLARSSIRLANALEGPHRPALRISALEPFHNFTSGFNFFSPGLRTPKRVSRAHRCRSRASLVPVPASASHQAQPPFFVLIQATESWLPHQCPLGLDVPALWNAIADAPNPLLINPRMPHGPQFAVRAGYSIPRLAFVQPGRAPVDAMNP